MRELLVNICLARVGRVYKGFMTHNPGLDAAQMPESSGDWCINILTPQIPVGIADFILKYIFNEKELNGFDLTEGQQTGRLLDLFKKPTDYEGVVRKKCRQATALLNKISGQFETGSTRPGNVLAGDALQDPASQEKQRISDAPGMSPEILTTVRAALSGRILFLEELENCLKPTEPECDLLDVLYVLKLKGQAEILPSLGFVAPGVVRCNRCGWQMTLRPGCSLNSLRCEQCSNLGQSRLNRGLFAARGGGEPERQLTMTATTYHRATGVSAAPERDSSGAFLPEAEKASPVGVPPLTPAQSSASLQLKDFLDNNSVKECLLWAVAGAGKTEVVMGAVSEAVRRGGQVLYATPRRDVVLEITPRLRAAFPQLAIIAVYGGSVERYSPADIVVATTHQVIRYYRNFSLVILDEVDAYPYKNNDMLELGVKRAAAEAGKIIYLTATPDSDILSQAKKGRIHQIVIPARHHGYPVPEPVLWRKAFAVKMEDGQIRPDPAVVGLLEDWLEEGGQVFVFVPTVGLAETYGRALEAALAKNETYYGAERIAFSHSKDPLRDQKREAFKKGQTRVFVTTSIMERGITVKRASVLVLEADFDRVFDEGSLIQMAGRAGRSTEFPCGKVVFVGQTVNQAMKNAAARIRFMNDLARKKGFLKPGL